MAPQLFIFTAAAMVLYLRRSITKRGSHVHVKNLINKNYRPQMRLKLRISQDKQICIAIRSRCPRPSTRNVHATFRTEELCSGCSGEIIRT
jgi:hypothetical protein